MGVVSLLLPINVGVFRLSVSITMRLVGGKWRAGALREVRMPNPVLVVPDHGAFQDGILHMKQ
jgi:hypothetical protein